MIVHDISVQRTQFLECLDNEEGEGRWGSSTVPQRCEKPLAGVLKINVDYSFNGGNRGATTVTGDNNGNFIVAVAESLQWVCSAKHAELRALLLELHLGN